MVLNILLFLETNHLVSLQRKPNLFHRLSKTTKSHCGILKNLSAGNLVLVHLAATLAAPGFRPRHVHPSGLTARVPLPWPRPVKRRWRASWRRTKRRRRNPFCRFTSGHFRRSSDSFGRCRKGYRRVTQQHVLLIKIDSRTAIMKTRLPRKRPRPLRWRRVATNNPDRRRSLRRGLPCLLMKITM